MVPTLNLLILRTGSTLLVGRNFVEEYAKFIAHKSEKLGSAGQLPLVRETLSGK
jgi:hypothetical protein